MPTRRIYAPFFFQFVKCRLEICTKGTFKKQLSKTANAFEACLGNNNNTLFKWTDMCKGGL